MCGTVDVRQRRRRLGSDLGPTGVTAASASENKQPTGRGQKTVNLLADTTHGLPFKYSPRVEAIGRPILISGEL